MVSTKSDIVEFEAIVAYTTKDAYVVYMGERTFELPKNQVELEDVNFLSGCTIFTCPESVAIDLELTDYVFGQQVPKRLFKRGERA